MSYKLTLLVMSTVFPNHLDKLDGQVTHKTIVVPATSPKLTEDVVHNAIGQMFTEWSDDDVSQRMMYAEEREWYVRNKKLTMVSLRNSFHAILTIVIRDCEKV